MPALPEQQAGRLALRDRDPDVDGPVEPQPGDRGGQQEQGFVTGLYTDPNETDQGTAAEQLARLLRLTDLVRVGLAGNLAAFTFTDASGATVTGADVDYNGSPAGYTADPQENIVYVLGGE